MVYGVNVTSPSGCTWSANIGVQVSNLGGGSVNATVDQDLVPPGTTVQLMAWPADNVSYLWRPSEGLSDTAAQAPTAVVNTTTTFTVTVSDGICTRDASITVEVRDLLCADPDIFVPNTFTPNGDGNNDILFVRGRAIRELEFMVFDRWGEKVFETNDQGRGWDGKFQGKAGDPAVFVYHLTVYCLDGQRFFTKGNVTVIR
jgi:gliding motility-associated-like protein